MQRRADFVCDAGRGNAENTGRLLQMNAQFRLARTQIVGQVRDPPELAEEILKVQGRLFQNLQLAALQAQIDGLAGDPSMIEREARRQGYGRPQERFYAVQGTSPFDGCVLRWELESLRVVSPCTNVVYDLRGNVVTGLSLIPLRPYTAFVRRGTVYVAG